MGQHYRSAQILNLEICFIFLKLSLWFCCQQQSESKFVLVQMQRFNYCRQEFNPRSYDVFSRHITWLFHVTLISTSLKIQNRCRKVIFGQMSTSVGNGCPKYCCKSWDTISRLLGERFIMYSLCLPWKREQGLALHVVSMHLPYNSQSLWFQGK